VRLTHRPNEDAGVRNVLLSRDASVLVQAEEVLARASESMGAVDAVVCAAGGWAGGSIRDAETLATIAQMHAMNTESAVLGENIGWKMAWTLSLETYRVMSGSHTFMIAAHLASRLLSSGGLLVLTGAAAALNGTRAS